MASPQPVNCNNCGGAPPGAVPSWVKICSDSPGGGGGGGGGGTPITALKDLEKIPICYTTPQATTTEGVPSNVVGRTTTQLSITPGTDFGTGGGMTYVNDGTAKTLSQVRTEISALDFSGVEHQWEVWQNTGTPPNHLEGVGSQTVLGLDLSPRATRVYQSPVAPFTQADAIHTFATPVNMQPNTVYWIVLRLRHATNPTGVSIPIVFNTTIMPRSREITLRQQGADQWQVLGNAATIGELVFGAIPPAGGGSGSATNTPPVLQGFLVERWDALTGNFESREIQDASGSPVTNATIVQCTGATLGNRPDLEPVCYTVPNSTDVRPGFLVVNYDGNGTELSRTLQDATGQPVLNGDVTTCDKPAIDTERTEVCYQAGTGATTPINLNLTQTGNTTESVNAGQSGETGFAQLWTFPEDRIIKEIRPTLQATEPGMTVRLYIRQGDTPNNAPTILYTSPEQVISTNLNTVPFTIPDIQIAKDTNYIIVLEIHKQSAGSTVQALTAITTGNPVGGRIWERNAVSDNTPAASWGILNPDHDLTMSADFTTVPPPGALERGFLTVRYSRETGDEVARRLENRNGVQVPTFVLADCPEQKPDVPAVDTERTAICYRVPGDNENWNIAGGAASMQIDTGPTEWSAGAAQNLTFAQARHVYQYNVQVRSTSPNTTARLRISKAPDPAGAGTFLYTSPPVNVVTGALRFEDIPFVTLDSGEMYVFMVELTSQATGQTTFALSDTDVRTGQNSHSRNTGQSWVANAANDMQSQGFAFALGTGVPTQGFLVVVQNGVDGTEISRRIEGRDGLVKSGATIVDCPPSTVTATGTTTPAQEIDTSITEVCYTSGGTPANVQVQATANVNAEIVQANDYNNNPGGFAQGYRFTDNRTLNSIVMHGVSSGPAMGRVRIVTGNNPNVGATVWTSGEFTVPTAAADVTLPVPQVVLTANQDYQIIAEYRGLPGTTTSVNSGSNASDPIPGQVAGTRAAAANFVAHPNASMDMAWDLLMTTGTGGAAPSKGFLVTRHKLSDGSLLSFEIQDRSLATVQGATIVDCPASTGPTNLGVDVERAAICYQPPEPNGNITVPAGTGENTTAMGATPTNNTPILAQQFVVPTGRRIQSVQFTLRTAQGFSAARVKLIKPTGTADPTQGDLIATSNVQGLQSGTTLAARTFTFTPAPVIEANTSYAFVIEASDPNANNTIAIATATNPVQGYVAQENENAAGWATVPTTTFAFLATATQYVPPERGYLVVIHNANDGAEISRRVESPTGTVITPTPALTDCPTPASTTGATPQTPSGTNEVSVSLVEVFRAGQGTPQQHVVSGGFKSLSVAVIDDRVEINGTQFREDEVFELPHIENTTYQSPVTIAHSGSSSDSRIRIVEVR